MMASVISQIRELQRMTVGELRSRWRELHDDEEPRSHNKQFLFRRLAWRVQELAHGGLSERARARAAELARDADLRVRPPRGVIAAITAESSRGARTIPFPRRDARLPSPGALLTRQYRGQEIVVRVTEDGFEWEGRPYRSLSAVAQAVTGQKWNGWLFFGLTRRKR